MDESACLAELSCIQGISMKTETAVTAPMMPSIVTAIITVPRSIAANDDLFTVVILFLTALTMFPTAYSGHLSIPT